MNQQTVLFTIDIFHIGGVATFIQQYTKVLNDHGHKTIIIGMMGDLTNPEKYYSGSTVVIIPRQMRPAFTDRIRDAVEYIWYLHKIFLNWQITNIHFSTNWSTFYTLLYWKSWFVPKQSTFYGAYYLEKQSQILKPQYFRSWCRKMMQGIPYILCNKIIVFSHYAETLFQKSFPWVKTNKLITIPGLIPKNQLNTIHYKSHKLQRVSKKQSLNIVCFGRAEPRKGLHVLLHALAILKNTGEQFHSIIASPINYLIWYGLLHTYEDLDLFDNVQIVHALNHDQQKQLLRSADLFVMPSQDLETFGVTMIESLAQGVPVIGTPIGAIPEILNLIDRRLITKNTSAEAIAEKIIWFNKLKKYQREKIIERSINMIRNNFLLEKHENKILNLYQNT
jgi:glycosyltransferase involved in cell wall biosynthesis